MSHISRIFDLRSFLRKELCILWEKSQSWFLDTVWQFFSSFIWYKSVLITSDSHSFRQASRYWWVVLFSLFAKLEDFGFASLLHLRYSSVVSHAIFGHFHDLFTSPKLPRLRLRKSWPMIEPNLSCRCCMLHWLHYCCLRISIFISFMNRVK